MLFRIHCTKEKLGNKSVGEWINCGMLLAGREIFQFQSSCNFREGERGMYSHSDNEDEGMIFNVICLNTQKLILAISGCFHKYFLPL